MSNGGYWAVLPATVRHDRRLTQTAKLLYAEISGLAQADGYCWATDKYFAEVLECSIKTVSRTISLLRDCGYIQVEKTSNERGTERRIYCGMSPMGGMDKNDHTPVHTPDHMDKNVHTPPIKENKKRENTGARACARETDEIGDVFSDFAEGDEALASTLADFREDRRQRGHPIKTALGAKRLVSSLRKLSGGDHAVMIAMVDKSIARGWDGFFALRADELPARASPGKVEETQTVTEWTPGVVP